MKNKLSRILLIVVQISFILFFSEYAATWAMNNSKNKMLQAKVILRPDQYLGWRQKENLDLIFQGAVVKTDRQGFRIASQFTADHKSSEVMVLGPSSAFGWGVDFSDTYANKLSEKLFEQNVKISVKNLSQIGYSILQGRRMWDDYSANLIEKPKIVILSYGINDLDRYRFYGATASNDVDYLDTENKNIFWYERLFPYSNFYTLLLTARNELLFKFSCRTENIYGLRSDFALFENMLQQFIVKLKKQNIIPVLVDTPYFIKDINPDYLNLKNDGMYQEATALANKGLCQQAGDKIKIANSLEKYRILRDVVVLNQIIKKTSQNFSLKMVSAYTDLSGTHMNDHFVDPVHPSALGHEIISSVLLKQVLPLIQ